MKTRVAKEAGRQRRRGDEKKGSEKEREEADERKEHSLYTGKDEYE